MKCRTATTKGKTVTTNIYNKAARGRQHNLKTHWSSTEDFYIPEFRQSCVHFYGYCNTLFSYRARPSALRPSHNLDGQISVFMSPRETGWGSYTSVLRVAFSSPSTTCGATTQLCDYAIRVSNFFIIQRLGDWSLPLSSNKKPTGPIHSASLYPGRQQARIFLYFQSVPVHFQQML
jgi:hypothetical protein